MRAASTLQRPALKTAPVGYERELLSFVSELRLQLASQQQQINQLAHHTTGEINRLWVALAQGGTISGAAAPSRAVQSLSRSLPAGAGRAAVGALGGGGYGAAAAACPTSCQPADVAPSFAGMPPDTSSILQQIYAMDASQNELSARLAALEGRNAGGGSKLVAASQPVPAAPAARPQPVPPSAPQPAEPQPAEPSRHHEAPPPAMARTIVRDRRDADARAEDGDDSGVFQTSAQSAAHLHSPHKPKVSSPLSPERGGSRARCAAALSAAPSVAPTPRGSTSADEGELRTQVSVQPAAGVAAQSDHAPGDDAGEDDKASKMAAATTLQAGARGRIERKTRRTQPQERVAENGLTPSAIEPEVPPLGLAASGVGVSPDLEYIPVNVGSEEESDGMTPGDDGMATARAMAATTLQAGVRGRQSRRQLASTAAGAQEAELENEAAKDEAARAMAATTLQAGVRGRQSRRQLNLTVADASHAEVETAVATAEESAAEEKDEEPRATEERGLEEDKVGEEEAHARMEEEPAEAASGQPRGRTMEETHPIDASDEMLARDTPPPIATASVAETPTANLLAQAAEAAAEAEPRVEAMAAPPPEEPPVSSPPSAPGTPDKGLSKSTSQTELPTVAKKETINSEPSGAEADLEAVKDGREDVAAGEFDLEPPPEVKEAAAMRVQAQARAQSARKVTKAKAEEQASAARAAEAAAAKAAEEEAAAAKAAEEGTAAAKAAEEETAAAKAADDEAAKAALEAARAAEAAARDAEEAMARAAAQSEEAKHRAEEKAAAAVASGMAAASQVMAEATAEADSGPAQAANAPSAATLMARAGSRESLKAEQLLEARDVSARAAAARGGGEGPQSAAAPVPSASTSGSSWLPTRPLTGGEGSLHPDV